MNVPKSGAGWRPLARATKYLFLFQASRLADRLHRFSNDYRPTLTPVPLLYRGQSEAAAIKQSRALYTRRVFFVPKKI